MSEKGFNIFELAAEVDADYWDPHTGYTYGIQDYVAGRTPLGIAVWDQDGKYVGYIPKPEPDVLFPLHEGVDS